MYKMYVIIPHEETEPNKIVCIEEKSSLANYVGVHRHTITNRFKNNPSNKWIRKDYTIYIVDTFIPKTKKTGFTDSLRREKATKEEEKFREKYENGDY